MSERKRPRILIVDDDDVILATTEALLEAGGYDVATHNGPFGASAAIMKIRPDLVLLDVNMPGLSGPGLATLVRGEAAAKDLRIYFYSSSEESVLREAVEETGADGFIRKGERSELHKKVAQALHG